MSKKDKKEYTQNLTDEEKKELQKMIDEVTKYAKNVVEDYVKNPSEVSGSIIQIHQNSPSLKD